MSNVKLKDFITAENEIDGQEYAYISQSDKTRKTTLQKIKDFILGAETLNTTSKTVTGAINENATSLSQKANDTDSSRTTTSKTVTGAINELNSNKAPLASPTFSGLITLLSGLAMISSNAGIELGSTTAVNTPFIDFHSSGNSNDNDVRIVASGGSATSGQGILNVQGAAFQVNGYNAVRAISGGYLIQSGQTNIVVTSAGNGVGLAITFPTAFLAGCDCVLPVQITTSVGTGGYINLSANSASKTGFTLGANSYVAQTIAVQWIAFGH